MDGAEYTPPTPPNKIILRSSERGIFCFWELKLTAGAPTHILLHIILWGKNMGQVTIYLDEKTEQKMLASVKSSGMSKSKWIAQLIEQSTNTQWPLEVKENHVTWDDFPTLEDIRSVDTNDTPREDW
jgi:hypothetical protein